MRDDCRAVLAVLPSNSGHIHPDENFQSIEVAYSKITSPKAIIPLPP